MASDVEIHYTCLAGRFCRDDLMLVNFLPMGLNVPMYLDNSITTQKILDCSLPANVVVLLAPDDG